MYGNPYKIHRIFTNIHWFFQDFWTINRYHHPSTQRPQPVPLVHLQLLTLLQPRHTALQVEVPHPIRWVETAVYTSAKTTRKNPGGLKLPNWKAHLKPNWNLSFVDVFFCLTKIWTKLWKGNSRNIWTKPKLTYFFWGAMAFYYLFAFPKFNLYNQWKMIVGRLLSFWDGLFSGANC